MAFRNPTEEEALKFVELAQAGNEAGFKEMLSTRPEVLWGAAREKLTGVKRRWADKRLQEVQQQTALES